jgi:hypothetical protein
VQTLVDQEPVITENNETMTENQKGHSENWPQLRQQLFQYAEALVQNLRRLRSIPARTLDTLELIFQRSGAGTVADLLVHILSVPYTDKVCFACFVDLVFISSSFVIDTRRVYWRQWMCMTEFDWLSTCSEICSVLQVRNRYINYNASETDHPAQ